MNFGGNPVGPYRVGLPFAGRWDELLNTDAAEFGGSGVGNFGARHGGDEPWAGQPGLGGAHAAAARGPVAEVRGVVRPRHRKWIRWLRIWKRIHSPEITAAIGMPRRRRRPPEPTLPRTGLRSSAYRAV